MRTGCVKQPGETWSELMASVQSIQPDLRLVHELREAGGENLNRCYQCATCSVVCNLSPSSRPFPRKEMLLAQWGQTERLMQDPDVWLCYQCNDCSVNCPREAKPGDVIAAVRSYVYRKFAFPSFMGRALANPFALPILFLVPVLIILSCIYFSAPRSDDGSFLFTHSSLSDPAVAAYHAESRNHAVNVVAQPEAGTGAFIDFNVFMPHSTVDALFVIGNIIIFVFAAVGFRRFWNGLQTGEPKQTGFLPAAMTVISEIVAHKRFYDCDTNRSRSIGHILLFAGFIGAMITTGLVLLFVFLPHYLHLIGLEDFSPFFHLPLSLPHPVKILGAISGVLMFIGGGQLIIRRMSDSDSVGANGYADNLFIWVIFFTGFTGMTSWLLRAGGVAWPAYISYFLHLVLVYFLLWYMPYSKFAHMIYRTLALIHARQIGRQPRD